MTHPDPQPAPVGEPADGQAQNAALLAFHAAFAGLLRNPPARLEFLRAMRLEADSAVSDRHAQRLIDYFAAVSTPHTVAEDTLTVWRELRQQGATPAWASEVFSRYFEHALDYAIATLPRQELGALACGLNHTLLRNLALVTRVLAGGADPSSARADSHDRSTRLPLRAVFLQALGEAIARKPGMMAIMCVRIDYAEVALDSANPISHEELMTNRAERLAHALREQDLIARLDRSRFAVLIPGLQNEAIALLAANKISRALEIPFEADGHPIPVRPSIGIANFPTEGDDPERLLDKAELARQEGHRRGESYLLYEPELGAAQFQRQLLEEEFRLALFNNSLTPFYQPQMDLRSKQIVGVETLLRWQHRPGEYVNPNLMIEIAEKTGLINRLSMWIVNSALRYRSVLQREGIDLAVSVNLTATNLEERELPEIVDQSLRTWGVKPNEFVIEITEGSMIRDEEKTLNVLERLKEIGVGLSVDDFGTGYSSLAYLKRLPLDELKIDQGFVRNMLKVQRDERIVRSVIDLAHNFDLEVVAEGVEDEATVRALTHLRCDKIQGYYLSKPMSEQDLRTWLAARELTATSGG